MILVLLLFLEKGATLTGPNEVKQCAGSSVHIICHYHPFYRDHVKYWCEGYYFNHCKVLLRTGQSLPFYEPLRISDDKKGGFFTIHMKNAKVADSGWYWCAIERVSRHVRISMQLIISAEEAEHCSVTESPQNVRETTTQTLTTCVSTTFRTTTITTSTMHTTLKTTELTEIKHETVPQEIFITEWFPSEIWSIIRWILFLGMCLYLTCFIACFEIC
ncbi:CMRF35-like molecule 3 isoform X2 [Clarias gariepinus]|uniref:CMRF35-like molecule 3 isoform X2 n=1 Tax=Clarias gariepinus TaxID=13013 RepID=UPI00234C26D2|nr:CMRF35-like molecule 3 isoform X2 [Clarias gariepinus]